MKRLTIFIFLLSIAFVGLSQAPEIEWQNTIGGTLSDNLRTVNQTVDGGYILGGFSSSANTGDKIEVGNGYIDYWILKLDSIGNIEWQNTIGGAAEDYCQDVVQIIDGGYIAFETKCNTVISAGDTIGDTTTVGINDINTLNATVYSFENNIYISVNELSEKLEIDIYNLAGKLIYSNVMKDRFFSIKLNQPNGNYIINVSSDSKKYSKKIFIV